MSLVKFARKNIKIINPFNKLLVRSNLIDKSMIIKRRLKHYSNGFKIAFNEFSQNISLSLLEISYHVSRYNYLNNGNNATYSYFKDMRRFKEDY